MKLSQPRHIQTPGDVVILPRTIVNFRLAICDEGMTAGKTAEKRSRLRRKWVLRAIASAVTPPDLAY
jgi:hypothetical protein